MTKKDGATDLLIATAIGLLLFDSYLNAYQLMESWGLTHPIADNIILSLYENRILNEKIPYLLKLVIVAITLLFTFSKHKKKIDINMNRLLISGAAGIIIFFMGNIFHLHGLWYISSSIIGFTILQYFFIYLHKFINPTFMKDRFDTMGREFEQNQELMENEFSVNIPYKFKYNKKNRIGYINLVNPFRATLVPGVPGSGKTYAILEEAMRQLMEKGFAMCVYDFKYPDLTQAAYSYLTEYYDNYTVKPTFHVINLDSPILSHRCNPLQPELMTDFSDAIESAESIMLGLNRTWVKKQGDFFVESAVNYVAASIWALKVVHEASGNQYCTFPHLIELLSLDYNSQFGLLTMIDDFSVRNIIQPFLDAWQNQATDQLEGQLASVRLGLSRITNKGVYWTTTGNDFSLDINNPKSPKILCLANNNDRKNIYGVVLSLYSSRMIRIINKKGKHKTALFFDELPTIFLGVNTLDNLIATGRSNLIAVFMGIQDFSQMVRDYSKEVADAIIQICGNIVTGMIGTSAAESISKKIGKIKIRRTSVNVSRSDTSVNMSESLEPVAPVDVLSKLGQGELAGIVADNYGEEIPMEKKAFIGKVLIDKRYKALIHKHKLPNLTEFPEDINPDDVLSQNMENIRNDINELSSILNIKADFADLFNEKSMKQHIDKFISISRKAKKAKILDIHSEQIYNEMLDEIVSLHLSESLTIKEVYESQNEGSEPNNDDKSKITKMLIDNLKVDIITKVDILAQKEKIEF